MEHVGAAVVGRVRVVDGPALQREGAQAVQLVLGDLHVRPLRSAEVVASPRSPLLLGE